MDFDILDDDLGLKSWCSGGAAWLGAAPAPAADVDGRAAEIAAFRFFTFTELRFLDADNLLTEPSR